MDYDRIIIGGGLVGLATALAIASKTPKFKIAVLEKENEWAYHQSGRNSGVIHAGVYYQPGSKKAQFALAGNKSMFQFCDGHGIPYDRCGKLIVATDINQISGLRALHERALLNGVQIRSISSQEAREIEPHVNCVAALHVEDTGIVDYRAVANKYVEILIDLGVDLFLGHRVHGLEKDGGIHIIATGQAEFRAKYLISTTGLYADRIAALAKVNPELRIIPFRGEYWHLKPEKQYLVNTLIYPIPNPNFPFLGVHMTKLINGGVHVGPNAVLAFSREGYGWGAINARDLIETLTFSGFWKFAKPYLGEGMNEMYRSVFKEAFLRSAQELVPEIEARDLERGESGVRAQALSMDGDLINDFHIVERESALFVLNAPSPAATASLEIGKYIAARCAGLS